MISRKAGRRRREKDISQKREKKRRVERNKKGIGDCERLKRGEMTEPGTSAVK
jgi:hypothetical protein